MATEGRYLFVGGHRAYAVHPECRGWVKSSGRRHVRGTSAVRGQADEIRRKADIDRDGQLPTQPQNYAGVIPASHRATRSSAAAIGDAGTRGSDTESALGGLGIVTRALPSRR